MQRALLVALLVLAPAAAGCIVDRPDEVVPASTQAGPSDGGDAAPPSDDPSAAPPPEEPPAEPEPASQPVPAEPPAPVEPPPPQPVLVTERAHGNLTGAGAASSNACCFWLATPGSQADAVTTIVDVGTVAVLVELRWADARIDLDLRVASPDYEEVAAPEANATEPDPGAPQNATSNATSPKTTLHKGTHWTAVDGTPGAGGGYARILVDDPAALLRTGEWTIEVGAKGAAVATAYELAVTKARVAPPPAEWTAFEP